MCVCELTNQSRLGNQEGGLKETGAKTEGDYSAAVLDNMGKVKKNMFFLSIKTCIRPVIK